MAETDQRGRRRHAYPKSHRLGGRVRFGAVFDAKVRETRGPLNVYALPNDLGHARLGISIGRRAGTAPVRNRIKRLLRESFRLIQHDLPRGYDFVIVVRPHAPLMLADYQRLMSALAVKLHQAWERRGRQQERAP
jgi:ribonuclease P protein component